MEERGYIEVKLEGRVEDHNIGPMDVDISDVKEMIDDIEMFLYPTRNEKKERPHISYKLEEGSAKHKFFLPLTGVILFNGLIAEVNNRNSIEFLENKRAEIIEKFQRQAKEKSLEITFSNSLSDNKVLKITKGTNFLKVKTDWIDTELYLYGEIYEEGGLNKSNLHINTKEYGKQTVQATKEQLTDGEQKLYKVYGVRVYGKQNLNDGSLSDLHLIDFIDYNPNFDKSELDILISRASKNWSSVDNVDAWLTEIRGGIYE